MQHGRTRLLVAIYGNMIVGEDPSSLMGILDQVPLAALYASLFLRLFNHSDSGGSPTCQIVTFFNRSRASFRPT